MVATIIIGIVFAALFFLLAYACARINHVKCPECGEDMNYVGDMTNETTASYDGTRHYCYPHIYQCPNCGKTIII